MTFSTDPVISLQLQAGPQFSIPRSFGTDVTGKVVRYLQESEVLVGEPYVEVEAMKMIMPHQGHRKWKDHPLSL
jgi:hypothetical protein